MVLEGKNPRTLQDDLSQQRRRGRRLQYHHQSRYELLTSCSSPTVSSAVYNMTSENAHCVHTHAHMHTYTEDKHKPPITNPGSSKAARGLKLDVTEKNETCFVYDADISLMRDSFKDQ